MYLGGERLLGCCDLEVCFLYSVRPFWLNVEDKLPDFGRHISEHEEHVFEEQRQLLKGLEAVHVELLADVGVHEFVQGQDLLVEGPGYLTNRQHLLLKLFSIQYTQRIVKWVTYN